MESRTTHNPELTERWIYRVLFGLIGIVGFFVRDTIGQVRTKIDSNEQKIELLENIVIELRTAQAKDSERYQNIETALIRLDDKIESIR